MRLLFCVNSLGAHGGIERVTIVKANAFAETEGCEVAVCYTDRGTYPDSTIHPLSPKVRVFDLGVTFWDLFPLNVKNLAVTAPRKFWRLRQSLKSLISDFRPDVVVSTGSYEKFALASLRLDGAVKVREYHFNSNYRDFIDASVPQRVAAWLENHLLCRFFDKSYLLTREDKDTNFMSNNRFDYQYNPCSFVTDAPVDWDAKANVVVALGRLVHQKNFESLLRIWGRVAPRVPRWQLWIVGDGDQMQMLRALAASLGIEDSVRFLGYRSDVRQILLRSKILAMTSRYDGFSLNSIEACSCGCVVVSYRTPYGPGDLITDGVDGVLVDYNDEAQFADSLSGLISDPAALGSMGRRAVERARDFDVDRICAQWMGKYKQLLARKLSR